MKYGAEASPQTAARRLERIRVRVGNKGNKQWVWLSLNVKTKEIVGVYIGDRSRDSARKLWKSLPPVYRQCAVSYTDFWEAYEQVIPSKRHQAQRIRAERPSYGLEGSAFTRLGKRSFPHWGHSPHAFLTCNPPMCCFAPLNVILC